MGCRGLWLWLVTHAYIAQGLTFFSLLEWTCEQVAWTCSEGKKGEEETIKIPFTAFSEPENFIICRHLQYNTTRSRLEVTGISFACDPYTRFHFLLFVKVFKLPLQTFNHRNLPGY